MAEITAELIAKYLPEAGIESQLFGGWLVTLPSGASVQIYPKEFKNMYGGHDLYAALLALGREAGWTEMPVYGSAEHILACMAHADEIGGGIRIVPELRQDDGCVKSLAWFVIWWGCTGAAWSQFDFGEALVVGALATPLVMKFIIWPGLRDILTQQARRRGQDLISKFPVVHGDEKRKTEHEEAKRKGWL